jgi:uncharacterized protein
MSIFLLPDGRLRAGWRFFLFLAFLLTSLFVFSGLLPLFFADSSTASQTRLIEASSIAGFLAVCFTTLLMTRVIDHEPFTSIGLQIRTGAASEAALGFALGVGLVCAITGVERAAGVIHFEMSGLGGTRAGLAIAAGVIIIFISAMTEEMLFRGYPFQRLMEGINTAGALAIASMIFGSLHAGNPHATVLGVINTVLAGILLSVCYLKTRSLWLPIGFHSAWNASLALVGLPVSGLNLVPVPWRAVAGPSAAWFHGGDYGPEGGIVGSIALTVGILYFMRRQFPLPAMPETIVSSELPPENGGES